MVDLNRFPFKVRFNKQYPLYQRCEEFLDEINNRTVRTFQNFEDKKKIQLLLEENFNYIGQVLQFILNYLNSNKCQIKDDLKIKLIELFQSKLKEFTEDQNEYCFFQSLKSTKIEIEKLPACWKCLTWQNDDKIFENYIETKKEIHNDSSNLYEKNELDDIYYLLNTLEKRIHEIKLEISLCEESIVILFNYSREYFKILLKFQDAIVDRTELESENDLNEETELINEQIIKVFSIGDKVEFFSDLPDAYEVKLDNDTSLRIQLKNSD